MELQHLSNNLIAQVIVSRFLSGMAASAAIWHAFKSAAATGNLLYVLALW
jgi:hypothetical protein